jgi:hypothetical protein
MMWGGSDEACALCQCASLGAINLKNNKAVCKDICDLLSDEPFGIKPDRTYVEFRDVPRENMVLSRVYARAHALIPAIL